MFKKNDNQKLGENKTLTEIVERAKKSSDFKELKKTVSGVQLFILYFTTLIDHKTMEHVFLPFMSEWENKKDQSLDIKQFIHHLPLEDVSITGDTNEIEKKIYQGYVLLTIENTSEKCILVNVGNLSKGIRETNETENEFSVTGPKLGFVESLDTNILLLRS